MNKNGAMRLPARRNEAGEVSDAEDSPSFANEPERSVLTWVRLATRNACNCKARLTRRHGGRALCAQRQIRIAENDQPSGGPRAGGTAAANTRRSAGGTRETSSIFSAP